MLLLLFIQHHSNSKIPFSSHWIKPPKRTFLVILSSGYLIEFQKTQAHQYTGRNKQIHSGFLPHLCLSHTHFSWEKSRYLSSGAADIVCARTEWSAPIVPEGAGLVWRHSGASARGFPLAWWILHFVSSLLLSHPPLLQRAQQKSNLEEVRRGGNAIMSHWALALCVIPAFPTLLCLHLMDPPDPYICRHSTSVCPWATCLQRGSIYSAASFYSHCFRWAMACSQQWWELHHVHRGWKHTSDRFSGLAAITTSSTSHMHVFSAAGSEKEVLSRHQGIFQIPLSSHSQFFFLSLCLLSPLLLSFLLSISSSFPPVFLFLLDISSPCSAGSHAVLCIAPNQHQQKDRAESMPSRSKATQQREIDGLCSQMCSAPLHFVCVWVWMLVICRMEGWVYRRNEREAGRVKQRPCKQLCFCCVYIINALLNRMVSTCGISSDHKCKYCHKDERGKLS